MYNCSRGNLFDMIDWLIDIVIKIYNRLKNAHRKLRRYATGPGQKLGNLGNLGIFFPRFFNPRFPFWLWGKIKNSKLRKLGITFPRFSRFSSFVEFSICHFFIFFLNCFSFFINIFSNCLIHICNYSSTRYFINTVRLSH